MVEAIIVSNLMDTLMRTQHRAQRAIIHAGREARARAPDQENMHLHILATCLAIMGIINPGIAFYAFINTPARNLAYPIPTYMLSVVEGFTFVSGIIAMAMGWLLVVHDNPRQHRRLANWILLLIQFASVFAVGLLLLACSSSVG